VHRYFIGFCFLLLAILVTEQLSVAVYHVLNKISLRNDKSLSAN